MPKPVWMFEECKEVDRDPWRRGDYRTPLMKMPTCSLA